MARDWTCARCRAANPEGVYACQSCGLLRGSVVPAPNEIAAPPPAPSRGGVPGGVWPVATSDATAIPPPGVADSALVPGWSGASAGTPAVSPVRRRRALPGVIIAVVLIAGVAAFSWYGSAGRSSTGEINRAGQIAVADLRVGDCYDLPGDSASFDPAASGDRTVDTAQARPCTEPHRYEVFHTGTIVGDGYPTEDGFASWSDANCTPAFEAYVGTAYADSVLDIYTFYPGTEGWANGDRQMQCSVADPLLKPLASSLKGSQR